MTRLLGPLLALALLALSVPAPAADGEEPAEAPAADPGARRVPPRPQGTPFQLLGLVAETTRREEPFPGREGLVWSLEALQSEARERPPAEREAFVAAGLDRVNAAAAAADLGSAGPDTGRRVNNQVAYLNNAAGNWRKGVEFSDRALHYDPDDRDALISRSNARFGLRDYAASLEDARRASRLAPGSSEAWRARALAAYGLDEFQQASDDARRALALDPKDRTAFAILKLSEGKVPALNLASIRSRMESEVQREYHGMVQQLNHAEVRRAQVPETPTAPASQSLVRGAAAKLSLRDYRGALEAAENALLEDPGNLAAHYYRTASNNLLGRYDEAARAATRGLVLKPSETSLRDARAWAYNRLGRYRDAIADSFHSLEVDPQDAYAYANLSYSHERMGDYDAMLRELQAASRANPAFETAYLDAAARHGLEPEARPGLAAAPRGPTPGERARRKSFSVLGLGAVVGGLLLSIGLIHLGTTVRRPGEGWLEEAAPRGRSTIDATYSIGQALGQGGMGVVYEAVDRALKRRVAVKAMRAELASDEAAKARFLEEARTVAALHHPGIVDIHSIIEDEAGLYLVFEFVAGRTVEQLLAQRKRLSLGEAKAILKQACHALDFAHRHGVVHRDLKPANLMLGDDGQVKVMDFGISRWAQGPAAAGGPGGPGRVTATMGTPYYMAPEQHQGKIRRESDLFALGVCLYEMTTGRPPWPMPADEGMKTAGFPQASELCPDLPPELDAFLERALQPDPELRVRTPKEFWALLERVPEPAAAPSGRLT